MSQICDKGAKWGGELASVSLCDTWSDARLIRMEAANDIMAQALQQARRGQK